MRAMAAPKRVLFMFLTIGMSIQTLIYLKIVRRGRDKSKVKIRVYAP